MKTLLFKGQTFLYGRKLIYHGETLCLSDREAEPFIKSPQWELLEPPRPQKKAKEPKKKVLDTRKVTE